MALLSLYPGQLCLTNRPAVRDEGVACPDRIIRLFLLCLVFLWASAAAQAAEVNGAVFAEETRVDDQRLTLRGVSLLRHLVVIKAYAGAFYLAAGQPADQALAEVPRQLVLHYFHAIPADGFAEATTTMIKKNVTAAAFERLAPQIEELNALYREVVPGDRYTATYRPGRGTELALNKEALGTVPGAEFARAFFSIWIGENPIDKGFRDDLLGGARP